MSILTLLGNVPVAVWIGFVLSTVIPAVAALATKGPSFLTGAITLLLSGLTGVLSTLAASGDVTWRSAGAAVVSWLIAATAHSKILAGTTIETQLHAVGSGPKPVAKAV